LDVALGSPPSVFRSTLEMLRAEDSAGGLVTSHKASVFDHCWTAFDFLEPQSVALGEIGVVYKTGDYLCGGVSDVQSGGLILRRLVVDSEIKEPFVAVVLGGGGSGLAAAWNLGVSGIASSVTVVESDPVRRRVVRGLVESWPSSHRVQIAEGEDGIADSVICRDGGADLVINATGMGKDRSGSPVAKASVFKDGSVVWDFNYRGSLEFLSQAYSVAEDRHLTVRDGWDYFSAGWSVVMSRVAGQPWTPGTFESFRSEASRVFGR
jgi:shikimate dehydrogenase